MRRLMVAASAAVLMAVAVAAIPIDICQYISADSYWYQFFGCGSGVAGGDTASGAS